MSSLRNPKSKIQNLKLLMIAALLPAAAPLLALDYPVLTPDPAAYAARREKFMAQLPPNSIAVLRSGPERTLSVPARLQPARRRPPLSTWGVHLGNPTRVRLSR